MNYTYLYVCICCISQVDCSYLIFRRYLMINVSALFSLSENYFGVKVQTRVKRVEEWKNYMFYFSVLLWLHH